MSAKWRVRECPACETRRYASDFETLTYGSNWNTEGYAKRRCPECYYEGPTWEFRVIREKETPRKKEARRQYERAQTVGDRMAEIFAKD